MVLWKKLGRAHKQEVGEGWGFAGEHLPQVQSQHLQGAGTTNEWVLTCCLRCQVEMKAEGMGCT